MGKWEVRRCFSRKVGEPLMHQFVAKLERAAQPERDLVTCDGGPLRGTDVHGVHRTGKAQELLPDNTVVL